MQRQDEVNIDELTGASQPNISSQKKEHHRKQTKAELEATALLMASNTDTDKPKIAPPPLPPKKAEPMPVDQTSHSHKARTMHDSGSSAPSVQLPRFYSTWLRQTVINLHLNKIFTRSRLKYIGIGLASFAVFAIVLNAPVILSQINYFLHPPKTQPSVSLPTQANNVSTNQAEVVAPENVLIISKINANAPLVMEPSQQEANIQKALQNGVVHYAGTAVPGEVGNVVVVGHSSNDWWEPGNYKFVFALLDKLTVGDKIQVNYSSKKYVYEVSNTKVVLPTDLSVLNQTSEPTLTLITCTPVGTNWKRLIVTAKQVEPLPSNQTKPQLATSGDIKTANLPGSATSFGDQISGFFDKLFAFFRPGSENDQPATNPPQENQLHLPEVS